MKLKVESAQRNVIDQRPMGVLVVQCDFNAPVAPKDCKFNTDGLEYGHVELEKGDKIIIINEEAFCLIDYSLIKLRLTAEFLELNTPTIFKVTSYTIEQ